MEETERTVSMKNSNDTVGNQTLDVPACITVPQKMRHLVPHSYHVMAPKCGLTRRQINSQLLRNTEHITINAGRPLASQAGRRGATWLKRSCSRFVFGTLNVLIWHQVSR
jgi:hypothetical protein